MQVFYLLRTRFSYKYEQGQVRLFKSGSNGNNYWGFKAVVKVTILVYTLVRTIFLNHRILNTDFTFSIFNRNDIDSWFYSIVYDLSFAFCFIRIVVLLKLA
ncbi:hypothetical protein V6Z11_D12G130600 [Gossypium hirsutum]